MMRSHCNNRSCKKSETPCVLGCIQKMEACYCLACQFDFCPWGEDVVIIYVPRFNCMKPVYTDEVYDEDS